MILNNTDFTNFFQSYWNTFRLTTSDLIRDISLWDSVRYMTNMSWESIVTTVKTNSYVRNIIYIWLSVILFSFAVAVWITQRSVNDIKENYIEEEIDNDSAEDLSLLTSLELRYIKKSLTFLLDTVVNGTNKKKIRHYMTYVKKYDKFHLRFGKDFRYTHQKNPKRENERYRCDICMIPVYNNMPACHQCIKEWKKSQEYTKNKNIFSCRSCDQYSGLDEYCMKCVKIDRNKMLQEL